MVVFELQISFLFISGYKSLQESIWSRRSCKEPAWGIELWSQHSLPNHSKCPLSNIMCEYVFHLCSSVVWLSQVRYLCIKSYLNLIFYSACMNQGSDLQITLKKKSFQKQSVQAIIRKLSFFVVMLVGWFVGLLATCAYLPGGLWLNWYPRCYLMQTFKEIVSGVLG